MMENLIPVLVILGVLGFILWKNKDKITAVAVQYAELFEVGGGLAAARKASTDTEGDWRKVFVSLPFVVILMLMPMVYFVVFHVITGTDWSQEIKASVVSAVISGVLFAIVGYALGTSYGSSRKTNMLAGRE